nr:phage minor capsid protein [Ruminiclostridium sufflavum]
MADNYDIRKIFDDMALDLIRSQRRNFLRHQGEQLKEGFDWEQWQLSKLRELNKYRQANKKIIGSYSKEIDDLINDALSNSFKNGEKKVEKAIERIQQFVIETPEEGVDPELLQKYTNREIAALGGAQSVIDAAATLPKATGADTFFGVNEKKLEALQKVVRQDMRKAQNAVLRKMDDVYRQTVYKAQIYQSTGAVTISQAVDMATKDFLAQGISCIQYKDGKMVNVASWAEMSLRTASHRATMLGEGEKMDEWDLHLVVITAHGNTCELCLPWQGKVLIDDVYSSGKADGKHTLLSVAIAAGLFHPNCRHSRAIFFPGITELPKQLVSDETALARYEAEQRQRTIENNIRKYKRLEAGSIDTENVNKYGYKVQEWQGALRQHLKDNTYLKRDYSRERSAYK